MLARKKGKDDSHTVLLEMNIRLSTIENRIEVSKISRTELPYDPSLPLLCINGRTLH